MIAHHYMIICVNFLQEATLLPGYSNLTRAAKELGIRPDVLVHFCRHGILPYPAKLVGRRWYYDEGDLEQLKELFNRGRAHSEKVVT
jgi:predicted site-specific integrase-resolvase